MKDLLLIWLFGLDEKLNEKIDLLHSKIRLS